MEKEKIEIYLIGTAHKTKSSDIMKIVVRPEYAEGLKGIDSLKKIDVFY